MPGGYRRGRRRAATRAPGPPDVPRPPGRIPATGAPGQTYPLSDVATHLPLLVSPGTGLRGLSDDPDGAPVLAEPASAGPARLVSPDGTPISSATGVLTAAGPRGPFDEPVSLVDASAGTRDDHPAPVGPTPSGQADSGGETTVDMPALDRPRNLPARQAGDSWPSEADLHALYGHTARDNGDDLQGHLPLFGGWVVIIGYLGFSEALGVPVMMLGIPGGYYYERPYTALEEISGERLPDAKLTEFPRYEQPMSLREKIALGLPTYND